MTPTPAADRDRSAPCRCGHDRDLHEHDRPGTDCGVGGPDHCASFRHATPLLQRLLARRRRRVTTSGDAPLAPVHTLAAARLARSSRGPAVASVQAVPPPDTDDPGTEARRASR